METEQIQELIDKYLAGQASPEEKTIVENWFDSIDNNYQPNAGRIESYKGETREFLSVYIRDTDPSNPLEVNTVQRKLNIFRWISAASILLALSAALYFHNKPSSVVKLAVSPKPLINDVPPGGNKAVLTLANGRQLVLTNAQNGVLATQGDIIIEKTSDGKVIYNTEQTTKSTQSEAELTYNTITTPRGGIYNLTMADGTQVWLNASSSIKYPVKFKGSERLVELTGEAYFEVAKNKAMPFKVKSGGQTVEVLGTHFDINSYSNESAVKTTLLEGSVKVTAAVNEVLLAPGQQSAFNPLVKIPLRISGNVNLKEVMAWKEGRFLFAGADIQTVMRQLERWYDVEAVYEGNRPSDHFNGKIPKNVNLSQVLKVLELSGVHFKIEGRKIVIH